MNWREAPTRDEAIEKALKADTGRPWYKSKHHPWTSISYANNNMSYGYSFIEDTFHLLTGIDGLGVHGKIESIFTGTFEQCQEKFYENKPGR